jgi:hypothetical protein
LDISFSVLEVIFIEIEKLSNINSENRNESNTAEYWHQHQIFRLSYHLFKQHELLEEVSIHTQNVRELLNIDFHSQDEYFPIFDSALQPCSQFNNFFILVFI